MLSVATAWHGAADKGVPLFWLTVMLKSDVTADLIKEKDIEVLQSLTNVTVRSECVCGDASA